MRFCVVYQNAPQQSVVKLGEVTNVERVNARNCCLLVEHNERRLFLSFKNDEEVYGWQEDIYSRSPLMGVSNPTNFVHKVHVGFDPITGAFTVRILRQAPHPTAFDDLLF